MTGPVYEYPAIPAWSRGWDDRLGPSWECDTDRFPVIKPEPEKVDFLFVLGVLALLALVVLIVVGVGF